MASFVTEDIDKRVLIIGCGNPSRSDDSVGLYLINEINRRVGNPPIRADVTFAGMEDNGEGDGWLTTAFVQQLGPELADVIKDYDLVIFVDAHTGVYAEEIRFVEVVPSYVTSAFSHHLEPAAIVALAEMLYNSRPRAFAVSVRGYDFQFGTELSETTRALADQALDRVMLVLGQHCGSQLQGKP